MKKLHILVLVLVFLVCLTGCIACGSIGVTTDTEREPIDKGVLTEEPIVPPEETTHTEPITEREPVDIEPITDIKEPLEETTQIETESKEPETIHTPPIYDTPIELPVKLFQLSDMKNQGRDGVGYGGIENSEQLAELETILDNYVPNISVAAYSLDGSKGYIYNGKQEYFSACTIKIPWMLHLCKELDKGNYDKDTILTYQEKHYQGGSGKIRYGSYGDTYSIEELVILCLSISDNVAYRMLVDYMGRSGFNAFADELGYQSFKINSWSIWSHNSIVKDYLGIWSEVYDYLQTDTEGARILKKACTNTRFNYGTLTLKNYDYSHKSGENYGDNCVYNDAGLVWAEVPYVYAVFTKSEGTDYDTKVVNDAMSIIHTLFA